MKNFKALTLAALTAFTAIAAPVANARPVDMDSLPAHAELLRQVKKTGVKVFINDEYCNTGNFDGVYASQVGALLICQDNAKVYNGREVAWTANDLDTIRHEVHHLIQDCAAGGRGNGRLETVFSDPNRLANEVLGVQRKNRIMKNYAANGADANTLQIEIEAFSVAAEYGPSVIEGDLATYCL